MTRQEMIDAIIREMVVWQGDTDLYDELPEQFAKESDEEIINLYNQWC